MQKYEVEVLEGMMDKLYISDTATGCLLPHV
jgi:hypothetical protein